MVQKVTGLVLLALGVAGVCCAIPTVPEIDGATGMNVIALLGGAALIIRGRKR